jgi:hypothetical protein
VNERQRDLFLYVWSRRRAPGQAAIALRGALIGAAGGLVFALFMAGGIDFGGKGGDLAAILPILSRGGLLLVMSVAAFAAIGFFGANRVYASQEAMYQSMLASGARVPEQKPVMQPGDRGPALAVGITVVVIIGFILYVAMRLG